MRFLKNISVLTALSAFVVGAVGAAQVEALTVGGSNVNSADFRITRFASGLNYPYAMEQLSDGSVLVGINNPTGRDFFNSTGQLVRFVDINQDGIADQRSVLYNGLPGVVTAVRQAGNFMFVTSAQSGREGITVLRKGATPAQAYSLVGSLRFTFPLDWEHKSYALAMRRTPGNPGRYDIFFNVGSKENNTKTTETVAVSGLLTGSLNGDAIYKITVNTTNGYPRFGGLTQIATGLRNTAGIAVQPSTGYLYFQVNGIDTPSDRNEPLSTDELNRILFANIGGVIEDFGFPNNYIQYRTGNSIGGGAIQPLVAFQPINGSESEDATGIAFAPSGFPAGLNNGIFIGFFGRFGTSGLANEENPLVYYDLQSGAYFHFISNDESDVGYLTGLLATQNSLFVADLSATGNLYSNTGSGVIYQIQAVKKY